MVNYGSSDRRRRVGRRIQPFALELQTAVRLHLSPGGGTLTADKTVIPLQETDYFFQSFIEDSDAFALASWAAMHILF